MRFADQWPAINHSDSVYVISISHLGTHALDIATWLQELGLERYKQAFQENEIDV